MVLLFVILLDNKRDCLRNTVDVDVQQKFKLNREGFTREHIQFFLYFYENKQSRMIQLLLTKIQEPLDFIIR